MVTLRRADHVHHHCCWHLVDFKLPSPRLRLPRDRSLFRQAPTYPAFRESEKATLFPFKLDKAILECSVLP